MYGNRRNFGLLQKGSEIMHFVLEMYIRWYMEVEKEMLNPMPLCALIVGFTGKK